MKKYLKLIISSICILFIIGILIFKYCLFGLEEYNIPTKKNIIELPKYSFNIRVGEQDNIYFLSIRSKIILDVELKKMLQSFEKYTCNNHIYYYDRKNNITITNYNMSSLFIYNKVELNYKIGKIDNNECGVVKDFKKIKYSVEDVNASTICYIPKEIKVNNENGIDYTIHYNCFGNLLFLNGMGKMEYFDQLISYKWISINNIIDFLDYQSEKENTNKTIFDHGDSILYSNDSFSLLICNNNSNYKNIYIDKKIENVKKYCKKN